MITPGITAVKSSVVASSEKPTLPHSESANRQRSRPSRNNRALSPQSKCLQGIVSNTINHRRGLTRADRKSGHSLLPTCLCKCSEMSSHQMHIAYSYAYSQESCALFLARSPSRTLCWPASRLRSSRSYSSARTTPFFGGMVRESGSKGREGVKRRSCIARQRNINAL